MKKDVGWKSFFEDNRRYADVINGIGCNGKQFVKDTDLIIMFIGLATMQLFPKQLLYMFDASENMISIGVTALRIISLSFIFAGFCIIATSVFQAFGDGIYSMFISIARQLLVLVPVAYLFSLTANINLIWFAFPIAEIVSTILCCIYLIKIYKKKIRDL